MKLSEKRTLEKKEQILLTAMSVVKRNGYDGATMEEIASELLMTKGALYYYFKSKSDLMFECYNFVLSQASLDLEEDLHKEGTAEDILRNMIATHISYAIDEIETFNLIIEPKRTFDDKKLKKVLQLRKHYSGLFDQAIAKGIATKEFQAKEPIIVRMIILGAMNWIQQWYQPGGKMNKEELQEAFGNYIIKILK